MEPETGMRKSFQIEVFGTQYISSSWKPQLQPTEHFGSPDAPRTYQGVLGKKISSLQGLLE